MNKTIFLAVLAALGASAAHADDSYFSVQASDYKNSTVRLGHITNSKIFVVGDGANGIETYLAPEIEVGHERVHAGPSLHFIKPIDDWRWDFDLVARCGAGLTTTTPARRTSTMGAVGLMLINSDQKFGIEVGARKVNSLAPAGYLSFSKLF